MKNLLVVFLIMNLSISYAQNINWSSKIDDHRSLVYLNFGYDFGVVTQVGYGKKVEIGRPIIFTLDYSAPQGKERLDDFKVRVGGVTPLYEQGNFVFSMKVYGSFRRHHTRNVRMASFGSEFSGLVGYYQPAWHLAAEFGFDKAIVTQLKHAENMRDNFPAISDGWFVPSGGNFFYGIQGSKSIGKSLEFSYRLGATKAQFNDENALLPYYMQLGLSYNFPSKSHT